MPEIASRADELSKCVNCGLCQSVCPTFLVGGGEGLTARGKIIIMKSLLDGSLTPSRSIADLFDHCLTCYACQTVCPAGVRTERLWPAARQDLARWSSTRKLKRFVVRASIGRPLTANLLARMIGFAAGGSDKSGGLIGLPIARGAPFAWTLGGIHPPMAESRGKAALLLGCSVDYSSPGIAKAAIRLLNAAGLSVIVPKHQACCGAPAINNGDWKTAKRLAAKNISLFNDLNCDWIVSTDATCSAALARDYAELFATGHPSLEGAKQLSRKTVELGHLLHRLCEDGQLSFKAGTTTAMALHHSCHATHIEGGTAWGKLLSGISFLELREMADAEHCCGFGGSYSYFHAAESAKIAAGKLRKARQTGASTLLVTSPGCLFKLRRQAKKENLELDIRHAVELLAENVNYPLAS